MKKLSYEILSSDEGDGIYEELRYSLDEGYTIENQIFLGYKVPIKKGFGKKFIKKDVKSRLISKLDMEDFSLKVLTHKDKVFLEKGYYYIGVMLITYKVII